MLEIAQIMWLQGLIGLHKSLSVQLFTQNLSIYGLSDVFLLNCSVKL